MKKIWLAGIGGAVAGAVISTQFAGPLLAQDAEKESSVYEQLDLFGDIFERIRSSYVEPVDEKQLIADAINGMLSHLDPHSSYMPPDDFNDMQVQTKGEFGGLGIEVTQENGAVKVVSPIEGTPADRAGVKSGDLIVQVNGESVMGLTLNEAVDMMRGPVGSDITITLQREGTPDPFDVKITRETITVSPVESRLEDGVVVLRLKTFNEQTYPELEENLKKQVEAAGGMDKVTGFVIDLRNNPGGLLNQAISVVDAFLDSGEIVSTRGRDPRDSERYNATPGDLTSGKPLAVVVNGGSASASEIVAGALKDHHRAVIIGTQTFGKGSVQTIMPVPGEGAIRLTTARYYTPSGRSIQALGVAPDIIVEQRPPEEVKADDKAPEPAAALRGRSPRVALQRQPDRGREENPRGGPSAQGRDRAPAGRGLPAQLRDGYPARHVLPLGREPAAVGSMPKALTEADILALPYRQNVGLMILDPAGRVFAGQRLDNPGPAWQMPQGGIDAGETPLEAAYRELVEETGIPQSAVELIAEAPEWITYELPLDLIPKLWKGRFRGQRQRWFLMRFTGDEALIGIATEHPEFSAWAWIEPTELVDRIVPFKRETYAAVLSAFRAYL